jgi:hypothetical protein
MQEWCHTLDYYLIIFHNFKDYLKTCNPQYSRSDMNNSEILLLVKDNIKLACEEKIQYNVIFTGHDRQAGLHEFLFFIKPEISRCNSRINLDALLTLALEKIDLYNLTIHDIRILAATYLEKYNIMAQHYGAINALSRDPFRYFTDEASTRFRTAFGKKPEEVTLLGSFQFLQKFPGYSPELLDQLWERSKSVKLAGGNYCAGILVNGERIYLINGFHPKQLSHFTAKGRSIVAFTLSSNLDWVIARNNFIGKTNPSEAIPGSLRNEILMHKEEFGLDEVSSGKNGFHLSAGPVEGLVELMRYCSDFSTGVIQTADDYQFGRQLDKHFSQEQIRMICGNHLVEYQGNKIGTFDLTEEKNSQDALKLLKECTFVN